MHVDASWKAHESSVAKEGHGCDRFGVDDSLSRSMAIKANNTIVKEPIWVMQIVFQPFIQTLALPLHDELHLNFSTLMSTDRIRSRWKLPVDVRG